MIVTSFTRRFLYCCFIIVYLSFSALATAGQVTMVMRHPVDLKATLNRVLEVNIEKSEEVRRSSFSLEGLARTLTALQPSLIIGFSHLTDETPLSTSQVALFLEIQKKILATNPRCKFGVTLSLENYLTPLELLNKLQEITTKLNPDIINMVVSSNNEVVSLSALLRGIEFAHAHGQLVSYEGPASLIPDGVDIFVMKALNGEIHRDEINNFKMKHHLPIVVQSPITTHSKDRKEIFILTHLAEQQASFGYHLAYPLEFNSSGSMSANKESSSLVMLRALLTRYN